VTKYIKEFFAIIIQLFMFYIFPLFAGPTDAIGMVFLILLSTFILSFLLGIISNNKLKIIYPVLISLLFIPSVWIYYNESALVHALWYLVISFVGLLFGMLIKFLFSKRRVVYEF